MPPVPFTDAVARLSVVLQERQGDRWRNEEGTKVDRERYRQALARLAKQLIVDHLRRRRAHVDTWHVLDEEEELQENYLTQEEWQLLCGQFPGLIAVASQPTTSRVIQAAGGESDDILVPFYASFSYERIADGAHLFVTRFLSMLDSFIAGGLAGACAKTVIAPGDRIKIIFQVDPNRHFTVRRAVKMAKTIIKNSGVLGLWTGHGATLMSAMPRASISYFTFDHALAWWCKLFSVPPKAGTSGGGGSEPQPPKGKHDESKAALAKFMAGATAGATATTFTYPLDLLRARFAAHFDTKKRYASYYIAVRDITREEGMGAMFAGLRPTLIGIVPYAGLLFMFFETFKAKIIVYYRLEKESDIPVLKRLAAGALAGLLAQSMTYPLEIVRRRMQVYPHRYHGSVIRAALEIYHAEGVRKGLFKGLSMNWFKGPISTSVSFTVNDYMKQRIRTYHKNVTTTTDEKEALRLTFAERLLCGAAAGGLAKLWTAPLDRMKILYAVGNAKAAFPTKGYLLNWNEIHRLLWEEGPVGLQVWKGSLSAVTRVIPYAAIVYGSLDYYQRCALRLTYSSEVTPVSASIAGAMASATATACVHPIDMIRTRNMMQPGNERLYTSTWNGLQTIVSRQGVCGLFQGLVPSLLGITPMSAICFGFYKWGCDASGADDSFLQRFFIGCFSGAVASTCTYPLNIVRRRAHIEAVDASFGQALLQLYHTRGFGGMYRRLPVGWVLGASTIGASFALNDLLQFRLMQLKEAVRHKTLLSTLPLGG